MEKITLSRIKYEQLKRQAKAYRRFADGFFKTVVRDPTEEVVEGFRKTYLYTDEFLADLKSGLRKSSYTKKHGSKTIKKRS